MSCMRRRARYHSVLHVRGKNRRGQEGFRAGIRLWRRHVPKRHVWNERELTHKRAGLRLCAAPKCHTALHWLGTIVLLLAPSWEDH